LSINDNALGHRILAKQHFQLMSEWVGTTKKTEAAIAELEAARKLQPNDPDLMADLALALPFGGRPDEARQLINRAREMNTNHPAWYFAASGIAHLLVGDAERAIQDLERWRDHAPHWPTPHIFLASAYGLEGEIDKAEAAYNRHSYLNNDSRMTTYAVKRTWPMQPAEEEIFLRGLKVAGVKEFPG
jgi:predicted Zn-dependent protease